MLVKRTCEDLYEMRRREADRGVRDATEGARHSAVVVPGVPQGGGSGAVHAIHAGAARAEERDDAQAEGRGSWPAVGIPSLAVLRRLWRARRPGPRLRPPAGEASERCGHDLEQRTVGDRLGGDRQVRDPMCELPPAANGCSSQCGAESHGYTKASRCPTAAPSGSEQVQFAVSGQRTHRRGSGRLQAVPPSITSRGIRVALSRSGAPSTVVPALP